MKILHIKIISADTCGGLLDGFTLQLRAGDEDPGQFAPICLVGPNGTGKSQFLQVIAEIFQLAWNTCVPTEERIASNPDLQFEIEYLVTRPGSKKPVYVRLMRVASKGHKPTLVIKTRGGLHSEWEACDLLDSQTQSLLPAKIVAYTSGGNETLSLPFLVSRSGYAKEVTEEAFRRREQDGEVPDTRLMLIDYGTHLEVLTANLLLGKRAVRTALLQAAPVRDLHSFRCVVQLAHANYTRIKVPGSSRKAIQITDELESYLDSLTRCSTCHHYDEKSETYTFDFFVDEEIRAAFRTFWEGALQLYSSFHKFSMLNDLAIGKPTRDRFKRESKTRRFASRLAEPQEEEKVFRFDRVCFDPNRKGAPVDYVSLSDGEHQLTQILGTMAMTSFPNVLFLLDEPESHFNPKWRVKFVSQLLNLPTQNGKRRSGKVASQQDCLLTTHAPFVPSDMPRERVLIFKKDEDGKITARHPEGETFGTAFDTILDDCFDVRPPISKESRDKISSLMRSRSPETIKKGMEQLGDSVEKAFLADRVMNLASKKS